MFNLLPENLKDSIKTQYKSRRLVVILFFVVCIELTVLIFIFPTWVASFSKQRELVARSEQVDKVLINSDINPAIVLIKSINSKLNIINTALDYPALLPIVQSIISEKNNLIKINKFSYLFVDKTSAELSVSGVSATREALVSYVKRLEETKLFKKVDLPISNLAKDKNIQFSFNLTVAP